MEQVTVKAEAPAAEGVPDKTPVVALSVRPAGNVPTVTVQLNALGKPVAVNVCV